jgi:hypothetical protein
MKLFSFSSRGAGGLHLHVYTNRPTSRSEHHDHRDIQQFATNTNIEHIRADPYSGYSLCGILMDLSFEIFGLDAGVRSSAF